MPSCWYKNIIIIIIIILRASTLESYSIFGFHNYVVLGTIMARALLAFDDPLSKCVGNK
jgi:hypothetical protein